MNLLSKKGQTEDVLADLIPAIVIMIIAIYLLSNMSSTHETNVAESMFEVNSKLLRSVDFTTYLNSPVEELYGKVKECTTPSSTIADVIIQIDPKNPKDDKCYQSLIGMTNEFNKKHFTSEEWTSMEPELVACYTLELEFPEESGTLKFPEECFQAQPYQNTALPLKNGGYVNITFLIGRMHVENPKQEKIVQ